MRICCFVSSVVPRGQVTKAKQHWALMKLGCQGLREGRVQLARVQIAAFLVGTDF